MELFLFLKHSKKLNFPNFYTVQWRHKVLVQTVVTVTYFMHCWGIRSHISRLQEIKKWSWPVDLLFLLLCWKGSSSYSDGAEWPEMWHGSKIKDHFYEVCQISWPVRCIKYRNLKASGRNVLSVYKQIHLWTNLSKEK